MSYTMKPSGVDWIGDIPAHWEVKRGKSLFKKEKLSFLSNAGIVTCFRDGNVMLRSKRRQDGFTIALHEHGYQGILKGMLAIHAMDAFAGAIGISQDDGKCSPVVSVCSARTNVYLSFYTYVLRNMAQIGYIQSLGKGIRERTTDFRFVDVANCHYIQPSLPEQQAIAQFLDDRTSAIDSKIEALKEKEESLAQLRKSIIHEAVTKGLDPKVPMRASGVDWIGDVPAHWSVKRLKDIASIQKGRSFPGNPISSGPLYPYFNGGRKPSGWSNNFNADENNIAVSEGGASAGYVHALKTKYWAGSHCYKVTARQKMSRQYLYYVLKGFEELFIASQTGSAMPNLQKSKFLNLLLSYTYDEKEQRAIAAYLDERTSVIDESIATVKNEIEALQELRKSLIHEAVTGKLDVADFGYTY